MKTFDQRIFSKTKGIVATILSVFLLGGFGSFIGATVNGKTDLLTIDYVNSVINKEDFSEGFNFEVTAQVVETLNQLTRTKQGRKNVKAILSNLADNKEYLVQEIKNKNLPEELLAVPFVESGYRSVPQRSVGMKAAGMWQFIPQTAKKYGLEVNHSVDERMKLTLETPAALNYLAYLNSLFSNWELALLSYNMGESRVKQELNSHNSKSAWSLIDKGIEGDKGYLAKVIAAAILLKYPQI